MHIALRRTSALLLGTAAGLGIVWGLDSLRWERPEGEAIELRDGRAELAELGEFMIDSDLKPGAPRGPLGHLLLTEPVADRLFAFSKTRMAYDPLAYFRRPPFLNAKMKWAEHPDGHWWVRTNSLGLREDEELARQRPHLRVFVTGDSHTDGVCNNSESFSNRLEAGLAAAHPGLRMEVSNAGVGGYAFYNYVGAFERYAEFDMDVFVVAVYGGNDFENVIGPYFFWRGELRPPWGRMWEKVEAGMEINRPSMAQGLMQICFFAARPDLEELAVHEAVRATLELERRCEEKGVELVVAYLPSVFEVQPDFRPELWSRIHEVLDFDERQLRSTQRQANGYLELLERNQVTAVDLRPPFQAAGVDLYWKQDLHLSLAGHQLAADVLQPHVEAAWRRAQEKGETDQ